MTDEKEPPAAPWEPTGPASASRVAGDSLEVLVDLWELARVVRDSPKGAERLPVLVFTNDPAALAALAAAERPSNAEALAAKLETGAELTADERRQAAELLRRPGTGRPRLPPRRVLARDLAVWVEFGAARARGLPYHEAIEAVTAGPRAAGLDSKGVAAAVTRINKLRGESK